MFALSLLNWILLATQMNTQQKLDQRLTSPGGRKWCQQIHLGWWWWWSEPNNIFFQYINNEEGASAIRLVPKTTFVFHATHKHHPCIPAPCPLTKVKVVMYITRHSRHIGLRPKSDYKIGTYLSIYLSIYLSWSFPKSITFWSVACEHLIKFHLIALVSSSHAKMIKNGLVRPGQWRVVWSTG